jgi:hypothetical protein
VVYEPGDGGLEASRPLVAAPTNDLAPNETANYLAAWRLAVEIREEDGATWARIAGEAAPRQAFIYVPGFSITKPVIQNLGGRLTQRQPVLEPLGTRSAGLLSPVVLTRQDARVLSHFVYLALRVGEDRDLEVVNYGLQVLREELVYLPAQPDPRCVHDAGWRLLLREFDDQLT